MERRVIWAIVLMMAIAIAPTFFLEPPKKPVRPTPVGVKPVAGDSGTASRPDTTATLPAAGLEAGPEYLLTNSFGFGGINATLLLRCSE